VTLRYEGDTPESIRGTVASNKGREAATGP